MLLIFGYERIISLKVRDMGPILTRILSSIVESSSVGLVPLCGQDVHYGKSYLFAHYCSRY